jgi:hypothetical protein
VAEGKCQEELKGARDCICACTHICTHTHTQGLNPRQGLPPIRAPWVSRREARGDKVRAECVCESGRVCVSVGVGMCMCVCVAMAVGVGGCIGGVSFVLICCVKYQMLVPGQN